MSAIKFFERSAKVRAIFSIIVVIIGLTGCAALDQRDQRELEEAYGSNRPTIEASYANEYVAPGEIWRVYLKGSDLDGDLTYIHILIETPCRPSTPIRLKVSPDNVSSLSGYLTLDTLEFGEIQQLPQSWLYLWATLEDRAGHRSKTSMFTLHYYFGAPQTQPPQNVFEEKFLGRIPVEFGPVEPCSPGRDVFVGPR